MNPAATPGKVYLAGGGPGDPGLLTLRTRSLMEQVDVVAYDALISPALLALVPEHVEMVAIGYRGYNCKIGYGMHPEVMELALQGKSVLRLKAGDPFIFGRGTQECTDLRNNNIPFEVVPGISSALGAAAYSGFPLTSIGDAADVVFASGHTCSPDKPAWQAMGQGSGTLAIYMGAKKIRRNCQILIDLGRDPDTPAIYISAATTADHFSLEATLSTLADKVEELNITAPALIIIGHVVNLRHQFDWRAQLPLSGQRALVVYKGEQGDSIQRHLENLGAVVFRMPEPEMTCTLSATELNSAMSSEQLLFTCAESVSAWLEAMTQAQFDRRHITAKLGALSEESLSALNQAGFFEVEHISSADLSALPPEACILSGFGDLPTTQARVTVCFSRKPGKLRFELPAMDLAILKDQWCYSEPGVSAACNENTDIYSPDQTLVNRLHRQQRQARFVKHSQLPEFIREEFFNREVLLNRKELSLVS